MSNVKANTKKSKRDKYTWLTRIGNAKESFTQIVRFKSYTFEFIVIKLKPSNA